MDNVLLCRWEKGWTEVVDSASIATWGRHEAMVNLDGLRSTEQVTQVALVLLEDRSQPRVASDMGIKPRGGDHPYLDVVKGATVTAPGMDGAPTGYRVKGFTAAVQLNGLVEYVPEVNALLPEETALRRTQLDRVAPGMLDGESWVPALPAPFAGVRDGDARAAKQTFTRDSTYVGDDSPAWQPQGNYVLTLMVATLTNAASAGDTDVDLLIDGVVVATATILAGTNETLVPLVGIFTTMVSKVTIEVPALGTDGQRLVVELRYY